MVDELLPGGAPKDSLEESEEEEEDGLPPDMGGLPRGPVLPDGIKKEIITEADPSSWRMPQIGDDVTVHYVGTLAATGSEFDSSRARGKPLTFTLGKGEVIPGWDKGLATMRKGETSRFTLAPEFAYGSRGKPPEIPEDAALVFEIELLSFVSKDDLFGDGGVIKSTIVEGAGWKHPRLGEEVVVSLKAMAEAGVVEEKVAHEYRLGSGELGPLSKACDAALQRMKKGEEAVLRCTKDYSYADPPDGVHVTLKLEEIYETRDVSFRKDGSVRKTQVKEGEDYVTPKEASRVKLSVEAAERGGACVAGFFAQVLEFPLGNGEVCDAIECAAADMRMRERAVLTVSQPALAAEARLGLQDLASGGEPVRLTLEMQDFEKTQDTWDMTDEERLAFCGERKAVGTALFKAGRLDLALGRYKKVAEVFTYIDNYPAEVRERARELKQACELNKAACYLKMKDFAGAKLACNTVLETDKVNVKAMYRRAQAELALKNFASCIRDCKTAVELDPPNKEVRMLLKEAQKGQKEEDREAKGLYSNMVKALGASEEHAAAANAARSGGEAGRQQGAAPPRTAAGGAASSSNGVSRPAQRGEAVQPFSVARTLASLFSGMLGFMRYGVASLFSVTGLSALLGLGRPGGGNLSGAAAAAPAVAPEARRQEGPGGGMPARPHLVGTE